jgi:apolipoprotein N-acyltransferase
MQIGSLNPYLLYGLIVLAYMPGLIAIFRRSRLSRMPVIAFIFLGMFFFTAAGSWMLITHGNYFTLSLFGTFISLPHVLLVTAIVLLWLAVRKWRGWKADSELVANA